MKLLAADFNPLWKNDEDYDELIAQTSRTVFFAYFASFFL